MTTSVRRQPLLVLTVSLVTANGALTQAAATEKYVETTSRFRQMICDPFGVSATTRYAFPNGTAWQVATGIDVKDAFNDEMYWSFSGLHRIGPHGEIGGKPFVGQFLVNADDYAQGNGHVVSQEDAFKHEAHWNKYAARLMFDTTSNFGSDQITSYNYVLMGIHTTDAKEILNLESSIASTNVVPPSGDLASGNLLSQYNTRTNQYGITILVNKISRNQILGVSLNYGPPGQNGQQIGYIGTSYDWKQVGQYSASLSIDGFFNQQFQPALRQGMLFVKVHTILHPQGAIRGRLQVMQPTQ